MAYSSNSELISQVAVIDREPHPMIRMCKIRPNLTAPLFPNIVNMTKVGKGAKIRNRYNQVPHLTQDTNRKVTNSQLDTTNESQEVSPFPAGDHKAHIKIRAQNIANTRQKKHKRSTKRSTALERSVKYFTDGLKPVSRRQPRP